MTYQATKVRNTENKIGLIVWRLKKFCEWDVSEKSIKYKKIKERCIRCLEDRIIWLNTHKVEG